MDKWTEDMSAYVRSHYEEETYDEMGRKLGVSGSCVSTHCRLLGFRRARHRNEVVWTDAMVSYLREHFGREVACDIADHLGVSAPIVSRKAKELGLEGMDSRKRGMVCRGRYVSCYKHRSNVPYAAYLRGEVLL